MRGKLIEGKNGVVGHLHAVEGIPQTHHRPHHTQHDEEDVEVTLPPRQPPGDWGVMGVLGKGRVQRAVWEVGFPRVWRR